MSDDSLLYFDAGVLLNILATEQAEDILQTIPYRCAITEDLKDISCFLEKNVAIKTKELDGKDQTITTANLALHYINIHKFDRFSHRVMFVKFARHVPEKKASLLALVVTNNAFLASDDLRTKRVLRELFPEVPVISTLTILHEWEKQRCIPGRMMRNVALTVQEDAQFIPLDCDPLLPWWKSIVGDI